jgi:hypothetical protein
MTELRGILSDGPNVADFLHLDINEVQARCLLIPQQVGSFACGIKQRRTGMKLLNSIIALTLVCTAVMFTGVARASMDGADSAKMDSAPGPAFTTVDGTITKIEGSVYTIQSESTGYQNFGNTTNVSEMKIYVGQQTKKLHGDKKVGDKVRAEITRGGFANSIQ